MGHPAIQILVVVASVAGLLAAMKAIRAVGLRWGWGPEVQRKGVHVATGLYAMALPFLFAERWPVVLLVAAAIAVMLVLRLPAFAERGLGAALHGVRRKSAGDLLLALAIGFVFLRSEGAPVLYVLPVLVVTLSDAAAALAGSTYGRRVFAVEDGTKSLEGVAIFFLVTCIVAMTVLLLWTDVPRASVVVVAFTVAAFSALVEADSWRGLDNLFVPIGVHFFLEQHLATPPLEIAGLALAFLASLAALAAFAPPLNLTQHAARAYAIAIFLITGVSGFDAALLPIAAVLAHLVARARRPCRSRWPDLDLLAAIAAAALLWLALGEAVGPSAVSFHALTFAGMALAYLSLAAGTAWPGARAWAAALAAGAGLWLVHLGVLAFATAEQRWHGDLTLVVVASLAACAALALARPTLLDRWRAPRIALAGALVPVSAYLAKAFL